jgi:hypothetical protein
LAVLLARGSPPGIARAAGLVLPEVGRIRFATGAA